MGIHVTEHIKPGDTVQQLKEAGEFTKMGTFRERAEMAVKALHTKGVRYGDLVGRNLLVLREGEEERVGIVDCDVAQIEGKQGEKRRWPKWVSLKNAFPVSELEE